MEPIQFGKYLLSERIAEGGMAVVYRAKLTGPGGFEKTLVVKQIRAELAARPEFIELFVKEAKTTVQLTHANIVPVFELGMVDGTYFLALELVDGPPLATLIERGPFPPPLAAYVIEQIARGLDYAHRREIVHRDLSPANVLCSRDGEVKLLDFGIAAKVSGRAVVGGSKGYVAPEQAAGDRVDARSDLYAVGVLLWEMLAGRRHGTGMPAGAPAPLVDVIERAIRPKPEDRWPSAEAMLAAITRYLRETEGSMQADLARLVRERAPDVPRERTQPAPTSGPRTPPSGPRTSPMKPGSETPALGTRALGREVTFATRFLEAESTSDASPSADAPASEGTPGRKVVPPSGSSPEQDVSLRRAPRVSVILGGLALVGLSVYAGAQLRDTISTALPPNVRAAAPPAKLRVTIDPPDAVFTVDGAPADSLPHDAEGALLVSPGAHTLVASAKTRPSLEARLTLSAGERRALPLQLLPEHGHVELRSEPPGAEVRDGDRSLGVTPTAVELPLDSTHHLRFERKDYLAAERALRPEELTGGPPRTITIVQKLEALPRGQLTLGARPWAHVTVDGERRKDTPLVRLPLAVGPHTVKLACPATGKELRFVVQVEAGKEAKRVADLVGEPHLID